MEVADERHSDAQVVELAPDGGHGRGQHPDLERQVARGRFGEKDAVHRDQDEGAARNKIEGFLAGALESDRPTHTM